MTACNNVRRGYAHDGETLYISKISYIVTFYFTGFSCKSFLAFTTKFTTVAFTFSFILAGGIFTWINCQYIRNIYVKFFMGSVVRKLDIHRIVMVSSLQKFTVD